MHFEYRDMGVGSTLYLQEMNMLAELKLSTSFKMTAVKYLKTYVASHFVCLIPPD
jgi:hypothetical protein